MHIHDPRDALDIAHDHVRRLREEKAAERVRRAVRARCPLEAYLRRRAAARSTPSPFAHGAA